MKVQQNLLVVALGLSLSACSLSSVKVPNANTYVLTDVASQSSISPVTKPHGALTVMPVVASRGFDSTAMMYQTTPYQLTAFSQNSWAAPPANMITPLMLKSLQQSQLFNAVIAGPTMNNTQYGLSTTLLALYQDFTVKPSQIVLSLDLSVGNNQSNQVIADRIITVRVNANQETPYAGVIAANAALSQALEDSVQFVSAAVSGS